MNKQPTDEVKNGVNCRIIASKLQLGTNITLRNNVVIAGDEIEIGDNVIIGNDTDIRAARIVIGANSEIGSNTKILVAEQFEIGAASRMSNHTSITCRLFTAGHFLYTADHFSVGYGGTTESSSKVCIGNRVALGPHNILNANCEIYLADKVGSGSYVTMWTHGFHFGHSILDGYRASFLPIRVERNVWLGYHVTVLPGVTIGENSIIAAGAMVASSLPADHLIGGVPARAIKKLAERKLSQQEAQHTISALMHEWKDALHFKGLELRSPAADNTLFEWGISARQQGEMEWTDVYLLQPRLSAFNHFLYERAIFVSVYDEYAWSADLLPGQTLFVLDAEQYHGFSSPLSEDLRDFFRRHALPCGFDSCYRSIEPLALTRLKNIPITHDES